MLRKFAGAALVVLAVGMAGCTSVSTMEKGSMDTANSKVYNAPAVRTVEVVERSVMGLGYSLQNTKVVDGHSEVYFVKSTSIFGGREIGRIDVTNVNDDSSIVSIKTEKHYRVQITGLSQKDFAKKLFTRLDSELASK